MQHSAIFPVHADLVSKKINVKLHIFVHKETIIIWVKSLCAFNCMDEIWILRARADFNKHFDKARKQKAQEKFNACQHQLQADSAAHWYCKHA